MKRVLKNSSGFTLVGVLVASTVGVIAVLGLTQLSVNIVGTLNRTKQELNLVLLSAEINQTFQTGDACTNSLGGYHIYSEAFVTIKDDGNNEVYRGGEIKKGVKIQEIRFKPDVPDPLVVLQFSLSDDTRETLTVPRPLEFKVLNIDKDSSDKIEKCTISPTL